MRRTRTRLFDTTLEPHNDSGCPTIPGRRVAVLFARADSHYKALPNVEVYDMERDARTYDGPWPVVAHPPCRGWGAFAWRANVRPDERNLARLAVALVRAFGGVLEHPVASGLWDDQRLPVPGQRDQFGGFSLVVDQHDFGHQCKKATILYVVGVPPSRVPSIHKSKTMPTHVIGDCGRASHGTKKPEISKEDRERTPPAFAKWLVDLAAKSNVGRI